MRVVKEAEERRNEILDVAQRLFTAKGFDNTSTNDILNEIGIARGTLYYHFILKCSTSFYNMRKQKSIIIVHYN